MKILLNLEFQFKYIFIKILSWSAELICKCKLPITVSLQKFEWEKSDLDNKLLKKKEQQKT